MLRAGIDGCLCKGRSSGETRGGFLLLVSLGQAGTTRVAPLLLWLSHGCPWEVRVEGRSNHSPWGESFFHDMGFPMGVLQLGHEPGWPQFSQYGQGSLLAPLRLCESRGFGFPGQGWEGSRAGIDGFVSPWLLCRCYLL